MPWTHILALLACAVMGGMGLYAIFNPGWASKLVRVVAAPGQVEGKTEFRSTYGGLFFAAHAFAAWMLVSHPSGAIATGVLGAGFLGSAVGRVISAIADKAGTKLTLFNIGFEAVLGACLLLPLLIAA